MHANLYPRSYKEVINENIFNVHLYSNWNSQILSVFTVFVLQSRQISKQ